MRTLLLLLALGAVRVEPDPWTPPPEGGDSVIDGLLTSSINPAEAQTFDEAMDIVSNARPDVAAEINASLGNNSVGLIDLVDQPGASDGNTLGLELTNRTASEVAGTIVHEWDHIKRRNTQEGYDELPEPCREAISYTAHAEALCAIGCDLEVPVPCKEYDRVKKAIAANSSACTAAGGTPPAPPAPCPCSLGC